MDCDPTTLLHIYLDGNRLASFDRAHWSLAKKEDNSRKWTDSQVILSYWLNNNYRVERGESDVMFEIALDRQNTDTLARQLASTEVGD